MAVAVCYHARLQERSHFERVIVTHFLEPFTIPNRKQFLDEIVKYVYILYNVLATVYLVGVRVCSYVR